MQIPNLASEKFIEEKNYHQMRWIKRNSLQYN